MTKVDKKKKKKRPTVLGREDFAFLCKLIMQGADRELDELWEETDGMYTGDDKEDAWVNDFVMEQEVVLFQKVDDLMQKVAQRFGYAKPMYPDDLLVEPAQPTPSVGFPPKAPPADPIPQLVIGRAS
jgi:hypothetical protein